MEPEPAYTEADRYYPWLVLSVTSLGALMVLLNLGTLNVALPIVAAHFHAGAVMSNWILLSYMLVNTILILVFGPLADIFGRRKLYLLGLTTFIVASLLIGFSPNVWILIALRAVQAVGGALIITNTTALIADAFPDRLLGTGLGINVLVASSAQLLGPVIGGLLASTLGWRWVFWFNVPIGVLALLWGMYTLRGITVKGTGEKVDWFGSTIVFLSLGGLIVALSEAGVEGWSHWTVIGGLALFVILVPLFIWAERRSTSPMIDFTLFRDRPYAMANLSTFLNSFAQTAVVLLVALFFQVATKETPFHAGLKVLPMTLGMLLISPIAGHLTGKYSVRLLSSSGLAGSGFGLLILIATMGPTTPYWVTALGMLMIGLGSGMFLTPNTTTIMSSVPTHRRGVANGIRSMLNNMGQVLSTVISLMIVTASLPAQLKDVIYAGNSASLSRPDLLKIVVGYRWAFFALFVAVVLGMLASLLRNSSRKSHPQT